MFFNINKINKGEIEIFLTSFIGGLACVWVLIWFYQTRDTPMEHPRISDIERDYIVNNVEYDASKRVIGHFVDVCFMVKPGNMLSLALCFVGIQ